MAATTTPDPVTVAAFKRRSERILSTAQRLRAECHDAAVGEYLERGGAYDEHFTPDGTRVTIGTASDGETVLIIDGAVLRLDHDGAARVCGEVLRRTALHDVKPDHRVASAAALLAQYEDRSF